MRSHWIFVLLLAVAAAGCSVGDAEPTPSADCVGPDCTAPDEPTTVTDGSGTDDADTDGSDGGGDGGGSGGGTVDTTPPQTTMDNGPAGTTSSTNATFFFSCDEGSCSYECQLDGGGFVACASPKTYSGLSDGSHTFEVRAVDAAGNVDSTPASRTWTVDTSGGSGVTGAHWVAIPGGTFSMGDAFSEGSSDERPVHSVTISAFEMYAFEVTNGEYQSCVGAGACTVPGNPDSYSGRSPYYGDATYADYPVIDVNWQQAADFCTWVGGRLPTEAEWEYAARGGLSGKRFPWGDTIDCTKANYLTSESYAYDVDPYVGSEFCATPGDTTQVGSYATNGYGLYDMAGNVLEWVSDWYSSSYYSSSPSSDPQGPVFGTYRVLRGGSFDDYAFFARVAFRGYDNPSNQSDVVGFRCAR